MMTDPIADMLTRIRNANNIERPLVEMPAAKLKDFQEMEKLGEPHAVLQVFLKYGPDGERVIRHIERYSKPGRRVYQGYKEVRRVLDGLGIAILSTSKGVMSDRMAKKEKVGGEIL